MGRAFRVHLRTHSIFFYPVRRRKGKRKTDIDFHVGRSEPIGKDAPGIRIGSGWDYRGPGHSDPPAATPNTRLHHTMTASHFIGLPPVPMTTNIDATVFPRITRKTMAPFDSTKFFRVNDAITARTLPCLTIRIGLRTFIRRSNRRPFRLLRIHSALHCSPGVRPRDVRPEWLPSKAAEGQKFVRFGIGEFIVKHYSC
jgi:hypothetical protein